MNSQTAVNAYENLADRLKAFRIHYVGSRVLFGLLLSLTVLGDLGLLVLILEILFYLPPQTKLVLILLSALVSVFLLGRYCFWPILGIPTLEKLALVVESRTEGMQQALISALQLWQQRSEGNHPYSSSMIEAAVVQANRKTTDLNLNELVDHGPTLRMAALFTLTILCASASFLMWPQALSGAAGRLSHPDTAYSRPPETWISISPGDAKRVAGDPLEITADITGVVPVQALLFIRQSREANWTPLELPIRRNQARHIIKSLTRSFSYYLQAGSAQTPACTLHVQARPLVTGVSHTIHYPEYTGLEKRVGVSGGDLVAPAGSRARIVIQASQVLESAWINKDSTSVPARTQNDVATADITIDRNKRYTIGLRNKQDISNRNPVEYRVIALQDRPPEVRLLLPGHDSELGEEMKVLLVAEARDDFGIASAEIVYAIEGGGAEQTLQIPLHEANASELTRTYRWDLSALDLLPGDQIIYRIRVFDTNTLSGPGVGESLAFTLRFPSLFEIHQEAQRAQEESLSEMERLEETSSELGERLKKIAHELLKENELDWQQKKELETTLDQQKEAGKNLEKTLEKLEQSIQRLEQSGLIEDETLQKLEEVQQLLSQLETPDLKKAMQKLQQALENVNPEAVQEALDSFREHQEAFQQNLERTISLLKRVQNQRNLDALVKAMEDLSSEQQEVVGELEKEHQTSVLEQRERLLQRDAERLRDEMNQVAEQIQGETGQELNRISEQVDEKQIPPRMNQMQQDLAAGDPEAAGGLGKEISEDLEHLARQLRHARKAFVDAQKDRIAKELDGILHDLLKLSRAQENSARNARDASRDADPAPLAVEQARILSGTSRLAERLMEVSKKTFFVTPQTAAALGKALQKMDQTGGLLQGGRGSRAAQSAKEAMGALNSTALSVRRAMSELASAASAIGFDEMLERMQQLAEQQGGLNASSQDLFGQPGFSPGQSPGLAQMAARQQAIRQAMEQLRGQMGAQREKLLGDMGDLLKEMDDVSKQLSRGNLDRNTMDRQRQILSRMLDAQRSVRERGWSKQRQARKGKDFAYRGPGSLPGDLGEVDNPLRARLKAAIGEGYPAEFEPLIRQYFERLILDALAGTGDQK